MKWTTWGVVAALTLGGAALAEEGQTQQTQTQQTQMQQGQKELTGKVVGVRSDDLLVQTDDQGAIIPLRVSHQTMVDGKELKKDQRIESHLKKEFQPGAEVRASFDIQKMENKAVSIEHKK